jgi:hypothetical protein
MIASRSPATKLAPPASANAAVSPALVKVTVPMLDPFFCRSRTTLAPVAVTCE